MPPESLPPWDRKDLFKERKHDKSESLGFVARWRDSYHGSREFNRWGSADFRRPSSYGKQGGWHQFSEESSHGYGPSRSSGEEKSVSRGDGKYIRNGRDSRGSFSHRDWRNYSRETNNGSANLPRRPSLDVSSDQRSGDDTVTYSSPQSVFVSMSDQIHSKDRNDKVGGLNGLENGSRCDVENSPGSTEWKPLKWTRSGSLSSRGSAFSGSMNSKNEKVDLPPKIASPIETPSAEAATCATSSLPFEETASRKKPRLGWGDGLAKYEKKKVDVPDVSLKKEGALLSSSSAELTHSIGSSFAEKSPKILAFSDCASPATPSFACSSSSDCSSPATRSFSCSSSSGSEEKSFGKAASVDNSTAITCSSPEPVSLNQLQELLFNLEKFEVTSIDNLGSSLVELLHSDDPISVNSSVGRSTALNKLLACKGEISKTLEMTESEIDLLETELKSLRSESGGICSHPNSCSAMHLGESAIPPKEQNTLSNIVIRPAPLRIVSSSDAIVEKMPVCNGNLGVGDVDVKGEEIDSPGTATSKFIEPQSVVKVVPPKFVKNDHCHKVTDAIQLQPAEMEEKFPVSGVLVDEDKTIVTGNECTLAKSYIGESISGNLTSQADSGSTLCDIIYACNKEYASRAAVVFYKQLSTDQCNISTQGIKSVICSRTDKLIKEKLAMRKQFLRFKERVLTLKFKAFRHSWKENLLLHSVRKCRSKPKKRLELSIRVTQSSHQKCRSKIRSRFVHPGAYQNPAPTVDLINCSSKLLMNPQVRLCRNTLKMPALILDVKEKRALRFISFNGLVEDPCAVEKERNMINPWTLAEREVFWEKLALFGKDFRKISSFLDLKTVADCIEFYYKNHKSDSFKKSKNLELGKQVKLSTTTYLVTSGKKRNLEFNAAASLDLLGDVSIMAAHADNNFEKCSSQLGMGGNVESKVSWDAESIAANKDNFDVLQNERETVAADVLAGICGSLSSEAMSSCITSSIDPGEGYREWRCFKVDSAGEPPLTPDVMQNTDNEPCSDDSAIGEIHSSSWTDGEKSIFIKAVSSHGKDFDMISRCVGSKSRDQCKVFFSKARKCLGLDLMHSSGDVGTRGSGNDGGGTDTEDPRVVETCTARSCEESGSKSVDGLSTCVDVNCEESVSAETANVTLMDIQGAEAVGNLVSDACKEEVTSHLVSDSISDLTNGVASQSWQAHDHGIEDVSDNTEAGSNRSSEHVILKEESVFTGDENLVAVRESKTTVKIVFGREEKGSNSSSCDRSIFKCSGHDSSGIGTNLALDARSLGPNLQFPHPNLLKVDSAVKSCLTSEKISLPIRNSTSQGSVVIKSEQMPSQDRLSSTIDFREAREVHRERIKIDDYAEHQNPLLDHVESSEISANYPLNKPTNEDMDRNANRTYMSEVQGLSKLDINCNGKYLVGDCYRHPFSDSKPHHLVAELPFLAQNAESSRDLQKSHARSASDSDIPCRNGDVKLFGQILSRTPLPNSNSGSTNVDEEKKRITKVSSKPYDLEINPGTKIDRNSYEGLMNVPMRSYGFWDGSRIQTGFSALPDSAILQAKYPAAFRGYSSIAALPEQQTLQAVANSGDRSLNGMPAFPTKDGVVEYQSYLRDGAKRQPFSVDIFSEMHGRTGFEALPLSSLQQQGRVFVGMNVSGRGGILMGGSCTGVSDPVAAIKMHYAKAEQFGQSDNVFIRKDGCWRGNGDLGSHSR